MKLPKMTLIAATALFAVVLLGIFLYRVWPGSPAFPQIPEPSVSPLEAGRIDLNTADLQLLVQLPGVGEAMCRRILQYRRDCNGFTSIWELENISGFTPALIERLRDYITIGGES